MPALQCPRPATPSQLSEHPRPLYQSLLTRRYLTSKVMPWLAMTSVALCCMLTLLVWSIMGGFLDVFRDIGRKMEGDVSIKWDTVGFAHYDDLIARLLKDSLVAGAAPVITTYGMVSLPDDRSFAATIQGVDDRYATVSNYNESLWWRPESEAAKTDVLGKAFLDAKKRGVPLAQVAKERGIDTTAMDQRLDSEWWKKVQDDFRGSPTINGSPVESPAPGAFKPWPQMLEDGKQLMVTDAKTGQRRSAAVPGIEVGGFLARKPGGWYNINEFAASRRSDGKNVWSGAFLPWRSITLTVLPMDKAGRDIATRSIKLPVANEYRTGFFETDKNTVLVHLSVLQKLLKMEQGEVLESGPVNPYAVEDAGNGGERPVQARVVKVAPAKVTTVLVKAKEKVGSEKLRDRCLEIYKDFAAAHDGEVPSYEQMANGKGISTWERRFALFIGQVEKETVTVLMILLVISLVCTALILAIFWSMVNEKTKDIGILRSVGCSRTGVAWVWLRYGAIIGVCGALLGIAGGTLIVWNINPIHDWLGRIAGISVRDPSVYYLPEIPSRVRWEKAGIVFSCAVVFSVLGALVPAVRAANMDPVRALRFE